MSANNTVRSGLSPQDYMEISQLYGLYARDVDPGSPRNAAWLFTDDAEFYAYGARFAYNYSGDAPSEPQQYHGQNELAAFFETIRENVSTGTRHFNTTYVVEKTPDGAKGTCYMLMVARDTVSEAPYIVGTGTYEDDLIETGEGWRFKRRIFRFDACKDDESPVPLAAIG